MYFLLFLSASSILVKKKARGSHYPLLPPSVVSEKFVSELVLIAAICSVSTNEACFKLWGCVNGRCSRGSLSRHRP